MKYHVSVRAKTWYLHELKGLCRRSFQFFKNFFEKISLNFSKSSFPIRFSLRHPQPSLFLFFPRITLLVFFFLRKVSQHFNHIQTGVGVGDESARADFEHLTFSILNQTLPNLASLSKSHLGLIWYNFVWVFFSYFWRFSYVLEKFWNLR